MSIIGSFIYWVIHYHKLDHFHTVNFLQFQDVHLDGVCGEQMMEEHRSWLTDEEQMSLRYAELRCLWPWYPLLFALMVFACVSLEPLTFLPLLMYLKMVCSRGSSVRRSSLLTGPTSWIGFQNLYSILQIPGFLDKQNCHSLKFDVKKKKKTAYYTT